MNDKEKIKLLESKIELLEKVVELQRLVVYPAVNITSTLPHRVLPEWLSDKSDSFTRVV